jgi:hypothetical protein
MVCPLYMLDVWLPGVAGKGKQESAKANLIAGRFGGYHLLNPIPLSSYESARLVADFGEAFRSLSIMQKRFGIKVTSESASHLHIVSTSLRLCEALHEDWPASRIRRYPALTAYGGHTGG